MLSYIGSKQSNDDYFLRGKYIVLIILVFFDFSTFLCTMEYFYISTRYQGTTPIYQADVHNPKC